MSSDPNLVRTSAGSRVKVDRIFKIRDALVMHINDSYLL